MIDWARVAELRADFGEDDFLEIVGIFLAEVEGKLGELTQSVGPPDSSDFHFLKGSAANLGFRGFQVACGKAERDQKTANMDEIADLFHASKDVFLSQIDRANGLA